LMDDDDDGGEKWKTTTTTTTRRSSGGATPLFDDYAMVAQDLGVYTARDYAAIVQHLVDRWQLGSITGLSGEAAQAQEFLLGHAQKIQRLADIAERRKASRTGKGVPTAKTFSWIFHDKVHLT